MKVPPLMVLLGLSANNILINYVDGLVPNRLSPPLLPFFTVSRLSAPQSVLAVETGTRTSAPMRGLAGSKVRSARNPRRKTGHLVPYRRQRECRDVWNQRGNLREHAPPISLIESSPSYSCRSSRAHTPRSCTPKCQGWACMYYPCSPL